VTNTSMLEVYKTMIKLILYLNLMSINVKVNYKL